MTAFSTPNLDRDTLLAIVARLDVHVMQNQRLGNPIIGWMDTSGLSEADAHDIKRVAEAARREIADA